MDNQEMKLFEEFVNRSTKHLVGVLMKRLELLAEKHNNLNIKQYQIIIKNEIKERVYENGRELMVVLNAFDKGVKFISAPVTPKKEV